MTSKRWIAVGLATLIFIVSFIIPSTAQLFMTQEEEETTSFFQDLMNEAGKVTVLEEGRADSRIALVEVDGVIMDQEVSPFATASYNHQKILTDLEAMKTDETVNALIVRVNSPGGGVYESAELTDKILEVKEARDIPVYTVMESMAASGGYYIAAPSEKIFAQAETITGSIGVIMQGFNVSELMDKVGIEDQTIKSGDLKDMGSTTRESNEEELAVMQELVNNMYERFVDTVESGRPLSREEIYSLADGRIYDGVQALEHGLVDELGYFDDALQDLREEYSLEDAQLVSFGAGEFDWLSNPFFNVKGLMSKQESILPDVNDYGELPEILYLYRGL